MENVGKFPPQMRQCDVPSSNVHVCQADSMEGASLHMPRILDLILRLLEKYRRVGVWQAVGKALHFFSHGSATSTPLTFEAPGRQLSREQEVLDLKPGDWVEVKPLQDILLTLDSEGKLRGLAFLPGMQPFCGKRFKVLKRMETLYQEESGRVRRLKNTVLLADVQCDWLLMKCDRSCFLFWREAWLQRVADARN